MAPNPSSGPCPVCRTISNISPGTGRDIPYFDRVTCPRCGSYALDRKDDLENALKMDAHQIKTYGTHDYQLSNPLNNLFVAVGKCAYSSKNQIDTDNCRAVISHVLSKASINRVLTADDFTNILARTALPLPPEQADLILRFLGDRLSAFGDNVPVNEESAEIKKFGALIGCLIGKESSDLVELSLALEQRGLLKTERVPNLTAAGRPSIFGISLSLAGWDRYSEINRVIKSQSAFVAMKFKDDDGDNYYFQETLFPKYLLPAVKQANFVLGNPLADNPKAGNIHARLELEIKNARFVVAELSHHNNGAYWEAGFAKGLGKPVIYMYSKKVGKRDKPHFDVGSDQIIFWDDENPKQAAQTLKDIIRNTLFGEAKQTDDPE